MKFFSPEQDVPFIEKSGLLRPVSATTSSCKTCIVMTLKQWKDL